MNTNTNAIDVNNPFSATRDTWLTWFMVNRSLNTSVNHRSYAEVLQSSCKNASVVTSHKLHKRRETTSNLPFASITADELVNCASHKMRSPRTQCETYT